MGGTKVGTHLGVLEVSVDAVLAADAALLEAPPGPRRVVAVVRVDPLHARKCVPGHAVGHLCGCGPRREIEREIERGGEKRRGSKGARTNGVPQLVLVPGMLCPGRELAQGWHMARKRHGEGGLALL